MLTLVVDSYGDRYKKFVNHYLALVSKYSDLRLVREAHARPDYDLSSIDAVVLSGSEKCITKGAYDPGYLEFIRGVDIPLLGVCYGHQVLALAYNQDVRRSRTFVRKRFPRTAERIKVLRKGKILPKAGSVILGDESHGEEVVLTDRQFEVLASSRSCAVESIRLKGTNKFGVQFHLERSGEYGETIIGNFYKIAARTRRSR
jgi:GMP synthase (glutamine-hydrolysing)